MLHPGRVDRADEPVRPGPGQAHRVATVGLGRRVQCARPAVDGHLVRLSDATARSRAGRRRAGSRDGRCRGGTRCRRSRPDARRAPTDGATAFTGGASGGLGPPPGGGTTGATRASSCRCACRARRRRGGRRACPARPPSTRTRRLRPFAEIDGSAASRATTTAARRRRSRSMTVLRPPATAVYATKRPFALTAGPSATPSRGALTSTVAAAAQVARLHSTSRDERHLAAVGGHRPGSTRSDSRAASSRENDRGSKHRRRPPFAPGSTLAVVNATRLPSPEMLGSNVSPFAAGPAARGG